jgi:hypothetical protein
VLEVPFDEPSAHPLDNPRRVASEKLRPVGFENLVRGPALTGDGKLTRDENIGNLIGIAIAYRGPGRIRGGSALLPRLRADLRGEVRGRSDASAAVERIEIG